MLTRKGLGGKPVTLRALQSRLRADEVFLEFALSEDPSPTASWRPQIPSGCSGFQADRKFTRLSQRC